MEQTVRDFALPFPVLHTTNWAGDFASQAKLHIPDIWQLCDYTVVERLVTLLKKL